MTIAVSRPQSLVLYRALLSNTVSVNSFFNSAASVELGKANATPDPACDFARYFLPKKYSEVDRSVTRLV